MVRRRLRRFTGRRDARPQRRTREYQLSDRAPAELAPEDRQKRRVDSCGFQHRHAHLGDGGGTDRPGHGSARHDRRVAARDRPSGRRGASARVRLRTRIPDSAMSVHEPTLLRTPPAFRRDLAVHSWIVVKALSDAGDAIWTIALAWTAVQITSP